MNLLAHAGFFLVLALAIVVMRAFYSEEEDGTALRSVPRRYAVFLGACIVVAGVMLVLELLFVSS